MRQAANTTSIGRRRRRASPPASLLLLSSAAVALLLALLVVATAASDDDAPAGEVVVTSILIDLPGRSREGDKEERCAEWAAAGECEANPAYMMENCVASCGGGGDEESAQPKRGRAHVYEGEDAAVGAFRFAEGYSNWYTHETVPTEVVLDVARKLVKSIEERAPDYAPPKDVTHCSSGEKQRPCSAGKLWKRAEEMRKEDMHDAAGADLIRALLKTGIEVDFVERCERSLGWAFGSVRRQRERERREAEEEAKLEARRQAEREAMAEAEERKKEYEADFVAFGRGLQLSLASRGDGEATVGADGSVTEGTDPEVARRVDTALRSFVATGPQGGNWSETLNLIRKISLSDKTVEVLLVEARCHEMMGNYKLAMSVAGKLIAKAANHDPWPNDDPKMMATTLGANAAMQLGLSENAISFYQNVLKFDPEQDRARKQYRGLKKVVKFLNKAEEQIQKGYNSVASGFVDDCLSAMRGLDVDSPLFRSRIQLKQCTILSGMGKHEEALDNCDAAVELRSATNDDDSLVVSDAMRKEAHLARGEALLLDMDYDEAVSDFREAFNLVPEDDRERAEEKRELHHKLQEAMHKQEMWNGGKKDQRFNEHTGYPDGRPPERDHAKILQLPIDLDQRSKEIKCAWLKKQFKALVRQYHPDKYKGDKKRGSRKFKEVKEAKEVISKSWNC
eukprot:CAMPEP_0172573142 /NCGR_PEP_ID=MMETSP1067-20121228/136037_1 /TAXON_ID=265564 ORGANISM="Thalassiosira punctigera, Strain Tpunct2005C2" /NCGR_SAMPLE_ID=MMETSP1067 /ASSEMBLY_ACC=CAM_ASM_000444 /LENGTH=679 /DNA_ID=CAMNT_0013365739 /DNA_START=346 /DNA_END=2385 /DNA_ORIENTATION=+